MANKWKGRRSASLPAETECSLRVPAGLPKAPGAGAAAPPSGLALMDTIGQACRGVQLPQELAASPHFAFLGGGGGGGGGGAT